MSKWGRKNINKTKTKRVILCVSHLDKVAYQSKIVRPILVGHNIPLPEGWLSDDTGDNISEKNKNYSELTAIYWAWKNLGIGDYEYVGLFHYRRILGMKYADVDRGAYRSGLKIDDYIDDQSIDELMRKYDVVLPMPLNFGPASIAERYVADHIEADFGALISVLIDKYPDKFHQILSFFYGYKPGLYYPFNMFIMRSGIFDKYCSWIFDILFEVERRIDISPDVYQARVFGFMSERLMALFFTVFCPDVNLKVVPFVIQDKDGVLWVNVLYSASILPNRLGNDGEAPRLESANADEDWSRAADHVGLGIGVIVRGPEAGRGGASALESRTMEALKSQWLMPETVRAHIGRSTQSIKALVESLDSEWLLFLNVGDECEPSALAALARHVERHPEWGIVYFDEAQVEEDGGLENHHFKPDFNIDYLRSLPYMGSAFAVRRDLFDSLGGFDERYDGIEEYDFILRAYEHLGGGAIGHVPGLVIGRASGLNLTERPLSAVLEAGRQALQAHFSRLGISTQVEFGALPATFRTHYQHAVRPLVSIIIRTRNQRAMLERCLESLFGHTAWPNYEVLVVDGGSEEPDALQYLEGLRTLGAELDGRIRVLDYPHAFNYSAMNNWAADEARGDYLLLLNHDTAALHAEWLDAMMAHAQRPEVGVVGAKLLSPDGKVQHAGVILGMKGVADCPFSGHEANSPGYYARLQVDQDYSAVSGDCLLVRKSLFDEVGGLDADALAASYSDVDLCLKVRERGKLVVWTPHALLLREGSKSPEGEERGKADPRGLEHFADEQAVMYQRWMPQIASDPAYNHCLSLASTDFVAEPDPALCWDAEWRPAPRVIAQPADRMGCGEYRIIAPTRALINAGRIQGQETDRIYTPAELARIEPDTLVLQRQVEPHQVEAIERHKRFNDVFCVFEIDDLITNLPVKSAHKKYLSKDIYKRFRRAAGACDRLVVATESLAEAYRDLSADVRVVPNFIEEARWGALTSRRCVSDKPRVGWAGGVSHTGDLEMIASVIEELKDEVDWVFFGMCPERLRPVVSEVHQPVPIDHYPKRLADLNLDLAVAPLEDVPFNHAKSHLRLLEYGILGYPVVCSDLTPYRGDFPVTRVRNRHREWVEAIREHVADLDASATRCDTLRDHVRKHWLLENNLDVWLKGWLP